MKILRIGIHGFALALANIASIIAGFGVYYLLKPVNQIAVQAPVAAMLSLVAFAVWSITFRQPLFSRFALQGKTEWAGAYFAAFLWSALIFVPLHYSTQGYLTSLGNIVATWLFQCPVNLLAVLAAYRLTGLRKTGKASAA